jgi:uncharacterized membrane protein YbhN (UPF0104 family)
VTLACLALLWRIADGETALRHLADADPVWIAAALLALTLQTLLSALRWRLTARQLGIALERGASIREYYLAQIVNQVLPGGVLGDAGRAFRARGQAGLLASGQAVIFERLAGQIALFAVFGAGVAATALVPGGFDGPAWLVPTTLLVLAGVGLVLLAAKAGGRRRPLDALANFGAAFAVTVAAPDVRTRQCAMSLGTALCNIAAFACCAAAVGMPLALPAALVLVPLILLSMLIPLTVSGWGLREGAAASLLPLAGATSAGGLAASVAFGLTVLLAALPGLIAIALAATPDPVES